MKKFLVQIMENFSSNFLPLQLLVVGGDGNTAFRLLNHFSYNLNGHNMSHDCSRTH